MIPACICVLLATLFCINSAPAYAASVVSEFDFSADDSLETYSSYAKKIAADGTSYVEASKLNRIDSKDLTAFANYRYGAYLSGSNELQCYAISNRKYVSAITSNVLTIYADPEVQFRVLDANNLAVADYTGKYNAKNVEYYHKSTDNGHSVYYIEFVPMQYGQDTLMVEFSTTSTTVQPHYSFWFGNPLTRSDTCMFRVAATVVKPNTSSTNFPSHSPYIQDEAWVTSITLEKQSENDKAAISKAYISVATPETTTYSAGQVTSEKSIVFNFDVNSTSAKTADGIYNFKLSKVTWNPMLSGSACYGYYGIAHLTYLYAFGY